MRNINSGTVDAESSFSMTDKTKIHLT